MLPLVFPNWKRVNVDTCLQEDVVGDIGHCQLRIDELAATAAQQHRDVRVAIRAMTASRPAAEQDRTAYRKLAGYALNERPRCPGGVDGFKSLFHLEPAQLDQDHNPALLLADCLEVAHGRKWNLELFAEPLRRACHHALKHLNPPERAQLWGTLGRLGLDDRPGVGLQSGLPDIAWVEVPAGAFLYGEKKRKNTLAAFRIARYPSPMPQPGIPGS